MAVKVISMGDDECELFADSKADITPDMKVKDLPKGFKIGLGSSVMTADGEVAFMKSDGNWNWVS